MRHLRQHPLLVVLLLWVFATAIDLDKPFHIDDTFHLKAGQWIEEHPLRPMSGSINWGSDPFPMYLANQPPGFFYAVAITGHFFGYTETAMHLMRSLFSLLAIVCFYRLARYRSPRHALLLTALLVMGPAFLVDQGVMTDVPLLALQLLFFDLLLVPRKLAPTWRYAFAGLALSAALFIKYSTLPLLVLFPIALWVLKKQRWMVMAAIPVLFLIGWSAWNMLEFGGVHILGRSGGDPRVSGKLWSLWALLICAGAMAPFTLAFLGGAWKGLAKRIFSLGLILLIVISLFVAAVHSGIIPVKTSDQVLRILFTLNGALLVLLMLRQLPRTYSPATVETWLLLTWAGAMAVFLLFYAPMMATRYVLLVFPPILLVLAPILERVGTKEKFLALACTAALGTVLTLSDKRYAGYFRDHATLIAQELKGEGTLWSIGHWGWQWYSSEAGMHIYAEKEGKMAVGDILVRPEMIHGQPVAEGTALEPIDRWEERPSPMTFFCVGRFASLYTSSYKDLPWYLGNNHRNVIVAYRVTAVP